MPSDANGTLHSCDCPGYLLLNRGSINLLEALSLSGGTAIEAATDSIRILHRGNGKVMEETIKLSDMSDNKVPIPVLGDKDIVYVPASKTDGSVIDGESIVGAAVSSLVYRVP